MRMTWAWLVVVMGCGAGSGGVLVDVEAADATLVVVQDGDGPWQPLELDPLGHAQFSSTAGFYGVGRFCPELPPPRLQPPPAFDFDTESRTVSRPCTIGSGPRLRVSGTTAPNAEIWVELSAFSADATGAYETFVAPGLHDVFALLPGAQPRLLVARDVAVAAELVLDLPLATEGVDLIAVTPTVTGAEPSAVMLFSDFTSTHGYVFLETHPTTVHVPPPSVLVASDGVAIAATAGGCVAQLPASVEPLVLRIPVATTATVGRTLATWTADPSVAWEGVDIFLSDDVNRQRMRFSPSASWIAAAGSGDAFPILDVKTVPGWTPELGAFTDGATIRFDVSLARGQRDGDLTVCSANGTFTW